jgi:hypothetical protein
MDDQDGQMPPAGTPHDGRSITALTKQQGNNTPATRGGLLSEDLKDRALTNG